MQKPRNRREFLADVGRGVLISTLGCGVAKELGLDAALAEEEPDVLKFGAIEPLVCLMQETPVDRLLPALAQKLRAGVKLRELVQAGALANARTFGGEDYVGFHTMMALAPALHLSSELTGQAQALPVFKVLYRNTNRIQEHGGRKGEVLHTVRTGDCPDRVTAGELLREKVRAGDVAGAEQLFATLARQSPDEAFNDLLFTVQDNTEVHRVVLPYRAWDLLQLLGMEQAHTLLRQSVRYCVKAESWARGSVTDEPRSLLPKVLEAHKLLSYSAGIRRPEDSWIDQMSQTIFKSSPEQAANAAAGALAEGIAPEAIGEAITLAANQLILRDYGRRPQEEVAGKPIGSVHGDSIGVHACDSANAWRNLARAANARNCCASLILGAYQVALDRTARGGDFLNWAPMPLQRLLNEVHSTDAEALIREADEAIHGNLQGKVAAIIQRYGELGHAPRPMFDLLLQYAVSEDGALHGEKFYRTVSEEFVATRPAFRWRHLIALGRVTASEYGRPAAGMAQAKELLSV